MFGQSSLSPGPSGIQPKGCTLSCGFRGMAQFQLIGYPRYPISYRIGSVIAVAFGKQTGRSISLIGYPPGGLWNGPIELDTEDYPPFGVSYGWGTRRSGSIVIISIVFDIPSILPYPRSYRIGIYPKPTYPIYPILSSTNWWSILWIG